MYKFCFIMHSVQSYFFSFYTHCIHNKTVTRKELTTRLTRYQRRTSISLTLLSWAYIRTCKTVMKTYFLYIFTDIFKQWSKRVVVREHYRLMHSTKCGYPKFQTVLYWNTVWQERYLSEIDHASAFVIDGITKNLVFISQCLNAF